jgi:transposase
MPATLDLNTLSEPLRAVFQCVVGERDFARVERETFRTERDVSETERLRLTLENKLLQEMIRLMRLAKYGPKAEQLSDRQLTLLNQEPGVTVAEVETEAAQPAHEKKLTRRVATPHGRQPLPAHLPRVEEIILVPESERHCATCGCAKCKLGFDVTEVLDLEPVKLFVRVIKREKLACSKHPEGGVAMGPAPDRIIPGGKFSDAFIADVTLKKYLDHNPLFRQAAALWRDDQVNVNPSVLGDHVMIVGELLIRINQDMRRELLAYDYLQADETPVGVQSPNAPKGQNHRAWQWQYSTPGGPVVFDFQMTRSRAGPAAFLRDYRGVLQTDAYSAYDGVIGPGMIHAGCWAHARRKFHEAHKLDPADAAAREVLERIGRLYDVERQAREEKLSAPARQQRRQEQSAAEVAALKVRLVAIRAEVLPGSQLAKACNYTLRIWERLEVFLEHGQVELDTNLAENAMRPVALGRKNWLHIGDEKAGPKIAAIMSVLATCRRLGIHPREYLLDVLPKLGRTLTSEVHHLTPLAWLRARQAVPIAGT